MIHHDEAVRRILAARGNTDAPVPVAAALDALGVNPHHASARQVQFLLETVLGSDRLRLGRDGEAGFAAVHPGISVEDLLDELYHSPEPDPIQRLKPGRTDPVAGDRIGAMTRMVIDHR